MQSPLQRWEFEPLAFSAQDYAIAGSRPISLVRAESGSCFASTGMKQDNAPRFGCRVSYKMLASDVFKAFRYLMVTTQLRG